MYLVVCSHHRGVTVCHLAATYRPVFKGGHKYDRNESAVLQHAHIKTREPVTTLSHRHPDTSMTNPTCAHKREIMSTTTRRYVDALICSHAAAPVLSRGPGDSSRYCTGAPWASSYQEAPGFAEIVASRTRMPRRFLNDKRETQTRSRSN